ncbi:hypothetical protein K6Y52_38515, partial [Burkholderia cenocepacia]|nr:hypothetical protein [Burkholderia cenocepacia]
MSMVAVIFVAMAVTVTVPMSMRMPVAMTVMVTAQQPDARQVDQQSDHRDGNRFPEMDWHRRKET